MLKVALSMLTLVPGGMGGSETYARELTRLLSRVVDIETVAYVPAGATGFSEGVPEQTIAQIHGGSSTRARLATVARGTLFTRSIRRAMGDADVIHYPFTVPVPRPRRGQPFVQTLLDVQHLELPSMFSRAELLYRRRFYESPARSADAVITISQFAKDRMIELLGIDGEKITVAHLGVDCDRFTPNLAARESFVLYPARGWPHKNHARLIAAMEIVRKTRPELRLVLTGGGLETLGELPDWVDRRGLVSFEELRELYARAAVLAFPSLYEGFGLPPLEAMASGCPVAASRSGSIPEVCGEAAVLFDAESVPAIAAGIDEAIRRTAQLAPLGLAQARKFTWERCAETHRDVYRSVA